MTPIYDITPFSALDYPGKLSAIVWFTGCNLRCPYCYNPHIVEGKGIINTDLAIGFFKKRVGLLDGVVLSGGEPTLFSGLDKFCSEVKNLNFAIKLDTNATTPRRLRELLQNELIDYVALDFKAPPQKWDKVAQGGSFEAFCESLSIMLHFGVKFEVRTTVHPSLLTKGDLQDMRLLLTKEGYTGEYYLQPYRHAASLGNLLEPPNLKWYEGINIFETKWRLDLS